MCETSRDTLEWGQAQEFLAATEDFLYPVPTGKVFCYIGICKNTNRTCWPKMFRCRYSENLIKITGVAPVDISAAKRMCTTNNTCGIEPVGGEGGIIETPIRDDVLAQHLHDKPNVLHKRDVVSERIVQARNLFIAFSIVATIIWVRARA